MRSLDLLELNDEFGLTPWVAVGVVLQGERAEGFADLVLAGVGGDFQVCIVVSRGISFDHDGQCCVRRARSSETRDPEWVFVVSHTRQTQWLSCASVTVSLPVS